MKKSMLLPLLVLVVCLGCRKTKDPEFRKVDNFKVKNFGLENVTVGFDVEFFNPNNFGVTVKEAAADVFIDSVYWGKFTQDTGVEVKRNADFTVPFSGKISLATALKMDLSNLSERQVNIKAEGSARVGKAGIFVSKPFKYEGKHSLADIKF